MNLKMVHKNDLGPTEQRESGVFHLSDIKTKKALDSVVDQEPDIVESEDSDAEIKPKKTKYDPSATYLDKSGMSVTNSTYYFVMFNTYLFLKLKFIF